MSLAALPKELILLIAERLVPRDAEALARTWNKRITPICVIILKPVFKRRGCEAAILHKICTPHPKIYSNCRKTLEKIDAHRQQLDLTEKDVLVEVPETKVFSFRHFDFFDLDSPLSEWLKLHKGPLSDSYPEDSIWETYWGLSDELRNGEEGMSTDEHIRNRLQSSEKNEFVVPEKFLEHLRILGCSLMLLEASSYEFNPGELLKVPANVDGVGGYLYKIYEEQQSIDHFALYMEPGKDGANCILDFDNFDTVDGPPDSDYERESVGLDDKTKRRNRLLSMGVSQKEIDNEEEEGINLAVFQKDDNFSLAAPSFEEYLAACFFELLLYQVLNNSNKANITEALRDYVRATYVKQKKT